VCVCLRLLVSVSVGGGTKRQMVTVTLKSKIRCVFMNFMLVKYVNPLSQTIMKDSCVLSNFPQINSVSVDRNLLFLRSCTCVFIHIGSCICEYSALQKYSSPMVFYLFCCITTCNLNRFLFVFHVMDTHKIVQIGEVKFQKIDEAGYRHTHARSQTQTHTCSQASMHTRTLTYTL
jgi:hypothetical protein